jgi:predicted nucleic acid-binding protein
MNAEFVDTNVLVYANDRTGGEKPAMASALIMRLLESGTGVLSLQVLSEFYSTATRKLGITSEQAEAVIADFAIWPIHRPTHASLLSACRLCRRYRISWWDALLVQSAIEMEASVIWSEDLKDGQRFGSVTVRNPFR